MFDDKKDETELQHGVDETVMDENSVDETVMDEDVDETVMDEQRLEMNQRSMAAAEKEVALDWRIGDVVLDLYEVKPVDEYGKAFHAGGFGKVYKVHHKTWNMDLAVKAPHAYKFTTQKDKDNYIKECQSWIELGLHPNIATCYYVRELGGIPRIFAEYVTGGSLKDWIESGKLYEGSSDTDVLKRLLDIAIQFAWGLHYAHEKGLIHQDVKPQNVMMTEKGEAKVVDFGLARAKALGGLLDANEDGGQSVMVTSAGGYTPAYCSPEQISKNKLTRRTDMWSWGVSVMEMFTGGVTWDSGALAAQSLESFLEHNGEEEDIPAMPKGIVELLRLCFKREEGNRPPTMKALADALIEIFQSECGEKYTRVWQEGVSDTADALNNYALSYLDLCDWVKAEALWKQSLELNPQHLESVYNYGLMLWRNSRMDDLELLAQIENMKATQSNSWVYYYMLGMIHMERSDAEAAIYAFEEAAKRTDDSETVQYRMSIAKSGQSIWHKHLKTIEDPKKISNNGYKLGGLGLTGFPDGRRFLKRSENENAFELWDVLDNKRLVTYSGHQGYISSVSISVDSRFIISGSRDNDVKLWVADTGDCLLTLSGHTSLVCSVAITNDRRYAISGANSVIKIWDIQKEMCIQTIDTRSYLKDYAKNYYNPIQHDVILTHDNQNIISYYSDTIYIWEFFSGNCLKMLEGHGAMINTIVITNDDQYVISGTNDHAVRIWNISTGDCVKTISFDKLGRVTAIAINPDQRHILIGESDFKNEYYKLKMIDIYTGQCQSICDLASQSDFRLLSLSVDGNTAISCGYERQVDLWRIGNSNFIADWFISKPTNVFETLKTELLVKEQIIRAEKLIQESQFFDAAKCIVQARSLSGNQRIKETFDAWAKLYRFLPKGDFAKCWEVPDATNSLEVSLSLDEGTNELRFVSKNKVDKDTAFNIWNLYLHSCQYNHLQEFRVDSKNLLRVTVSLSVHFAVKESAANISPYGLDVYELATNKCLCTLEGHKRSVTTAIISSDERYVISGSYDHTVRIWDVASGKCLAICQGHTKPVSAIAVSPDSRYVISGSDDGTIRQWEIGTGKCLRTFSGTSDMSVSALAFTPNGEFVIFSQGCVIYLWDIRKETLVRQFAGHKDIVKVLAITPDGRFIVSGSGAIVFSKIDNTIRIWNVSTGKCVYISDENQYAINSIIVSADSRYVLAKQMFGTMRLWEITWNLEFREQADWDDGAEPYLKNFMTNNQYEKKGMLKRKVIFEWTEEDFNRLITELGYRGYGWLRPEGVKNKLIEMKNALMQNRG